jgi:hypothetical protein
VTTTTLDKKAFKAAGKWAILNLNHPHPNPLPLAGEGAKIKIAPLDLSAINRNKK